jgi:hypothetical protein
VTKNNGQDATYQRDYWKYPKDEARDGLPTRFGFQRNWDSRRWDGQVTVAPAANLGVFLNPFIAVRTFPHGVTLDCILISRPTDNIQLTASECNCPVGSSVLSAEQHELKAKQLVVVKSRGPWTTDPRYLAVWERNRSERKGRRSRDTEAD